MAAAGHGSLQVHDDNGKDYSVDAFSKKELARRPEVRFINTYAVLLTYVLMGLIGLGVLELLWATVVLGSFVSSLNKEDLRDITFITLLQATGLVVISSSPLTHTHTRVVCLDQLRILLKKTLHVWILLKVFVFLFLYNLLYISHA